MQFLTGFPGFLGSALASRLLERGDEPVVCLVEPRFRDVADRRAAALSAAGGHDADRLRVVEGDVTDPALALDEYDALRREATEVFHLAAVYDLGVERTLAERVNVDGTAHVLDFAEAAAVDRFHYVSTCYVSGRYEGTFTHEDLVEGQSFHNHYEATKYAAEVAVRERMDAGLPATVYRPAIAVGDSRTGETQKYDGPYYLLRLLLRQPRVAFVPIPLGASTTHLNVVPRDFVVDAIAELSRRPETAGEVFQLCNPDPPTVTRLVELFARAADRRPVQVPGTTRLARAALERVPGLADAVGVEPAALPYLSQPTAYSNANARRVLDGTGIECPPLSSYVDRLVAFAREHPESELGP